MINKYGGCYLYNGSSTDKHARVRIRMTKSGKLCKADWYRVNTKKARVNKQLQRDRFSKILHELKENGCAICGYDKCDTALDFHHVNPQDKKFALNLRGAISPMTTMWNKNFAEEINKCILLCKNCHNEIHYKERQNKKEVK